MRPLYILRPSLKTQVVRSRATLLQTLSRNAQLQHLGSGVDMVKGTELEMIEGL